MFAYELVSLSVRRSLESFGHIFIKLLRNWASVKEKQPQSGNVMKYGAGMFAFCCAVMFLRHW